MKKTTQTKEAATIEQPKVIHIPSQEGVNKPDPISGLTKYQEMCFRTTVLGHAATIFAAPQFAAAANDAAVLKLAETFYLYVTGGLKEAAQEAKQAGTGNTTEPPKFA